MGGDIEGCSKQLGDEAIGGKCPSRKNDNRDHGGLREAPDLRGARISTT